MSKNKDAGIRQTLQSKRMIADALIRLMETDSFDQITITQICQEALITRQTYYRNFQSKEDILRFRIHEYLQNYSAQHEFTADVSASTYRLFSEFPIPKELLRLIHSQNLTFLLEQEMSGFIRKSSKKIQFKHLLDSDKYDDYLTQFIANTLLAILLTWVRHDFVETPQELSQLAHGMLKIER